MVSYPRRPVLNKELYHGRWNGRNVSFDRIFRGRRFTDAECQALCDGELIEVHNIGDGHIAYGVLGGLKESIICSGEVVFKTIDTLINNPNYDFSRRKRRFMDDRGVDLSSGGIKDIDSTEQMSMDLISGTLDSFSNDDDARLAAVIAGNLIQDVPAVEPIDYIINEDVPVYVPVLPGIGTFTKDGLVLDEPIGSVFEFIGFVDNNLNPVSMEPVHQSDDNPEEDYEPLGFVDTDPDAEELEDWDDGWYPEDMDSTE